MKILHVCLSCFYIDNALYQENEIVRQHVKDGHEVLVIASTESMDSSGQLTYVDPGTYPGTDGAPVKRLPYRKFAPHMIMRKLRMHPNLFSEISSFQPDIIIFHGASGWEIKTVSDYVKKHRNVKLFIDSHEDYNNSARSFISREILYKRYYAPLLRHAAKVSENILCISLETIDFANEIYRLPHEKLEFFPLGGRPLPDADYFSRRSDWRKILGLAESDIMFFQSGKFDRRKRLLETLRSFSTVSDPSFRLFLSGVLSDPENETEIRDIIDADPRIEFLGWSDTDKLVSLLTACDVYLQPGTQSVTMQNSLCQRCAVVLDNVKSHLPFVDGNGFFTQSGDDLPDIFRQIGERRDEIPAMRARSHEIALQMLDYEKLAARFL